MKKLENVEMKNYTTMGVGGSVRHFVHVEKKEDIEEAVALAKAEHLPIVVLGEGSNMIFPDEILNVVVLKIEISGFEVLNEDDTSVEIKIGAGENWDSVVARAVDMDYSGIEALSAIPGTTGATPFQNVGAYGQEIKNVIEFVDVYDTREEKFVTLSNAECKFEYRDSIFRSGEKGRYIIASLVLKLSKFPPNVPNYPGVKKYFEENGNSNPTLQEIRQAIIEIRANKLPDPKIIKNNGSFFKNPIVDTVVAQQIKEKYPDMTNYLAGENKTKLSAGWLIENCGLKGKDLGEMKIYENNALVLVNKGNANFADLEKAKDFVINEVKNKFGIILEPEPVFVN
jgi:UDP-N-acetylmuramate dehydrogenase